MNIQLGEKIRSNCILEKCEVYKTIVALSNNGDIDGVIVCPEIFCNRMKLVNTCSSCGKNKTIFEGCFKDENFYCYNCEEREQIEKEIPIINEDLFSQIEQFMVNETKNKDFMVLYSDIEDEQGLIRFFNPLNSYPDPLIVKTNSVFEDIREDLLGFFETMIKKGGE